MRAIVSPLDGFPSPFGRRSGAAFSVNFTGLTDGEARIGDHAGIGYTINPDNGTETVAWGTSAGDDTYGTAANPTDYTAGDEGRLWLTVTDGGETITRSAPIRYAPGVAPSVADGQTFTVDDTSVDLDGSASGDNLTFSYAATGLPAGVSINASTGAITGTPTEVDSGTVTITATDQYGRTLTDTFTFTSALRTQATAANGLGPFSVTVDDEAISINFVPDFTANGNTLTYAITGLPAGGVDDGDGTASGTPTEAATGNLVCTATDEYGRQTTSTASLITSLRTQATAANGLGPYSFTQDEAITSTDLSADFTANGNTLTYTISPALPAGLSLASNGALTGTPTIATASASYTVTGTDEYGRETDSAFDLSVAEASTGTTILTRAGNTVVDRAGNEIILREAA